MCPMEFLRETTGRCQRASIARSQNLTSAGATSGETPTPTVFAGFQKFAYDLDAQGAAEQRA